MNAVAKEVPMSDDSDTFTAPNGVTLQRSKLYVDGMGNVIAKLYTIDKQADADATDHLMAYYLDHNLISAENVPGADDRFAPDEAESFCGALSHAGFTDWENPLPAQGVQLNDYTKFDPCVDTSAHPGITGGAFWTKQQTAWSKDEAGSSRSFWVVDLYYGYLGNSNANYRARVRPVRRAVPAGQWLALGQ
ncbi:MAG TPA: DUF1566 domain-containing protein [Dyella sp.]|nr:DUF1566 domain-containing protein [Dyella sp.]